VPEIVDPGFRRRWPARPRSETRWPRRWRGARCSLRARWRHAIALVWLFNLVGLGDMLSNLANGIRLQVAEHLGAAWFGIAFVVPLMLVVHVLIFAFLADARRGGAAPFLGRASPS
jgi:hypothetical protein